MAAIRHRAKQTQRHQIDSKRISKCGEKQKQLCRIVGKAKETPMGKDKLTHIKNGLAKYINALT